MMAAVSRSVNKVGFECEFVTKPPDCLQVECPVCLNIIFFKNLIKLLAVGRASVKSVSQLLNFPQIVPKPLAPVINKSATKCFPTRDCNSHSMSI